MALFRTAESSFLPGLFHVGFSARVESVSGGQFLAADSSGECVLVDHASAPLWHFVSRDLGSTSDADNSAPRCVVTIALPSSPTRYLCVHGEAPRVKDSPGTVRVALPSKRDARNTDIQVSFSQIRQDNRFVSTRNSRDKLSVFSGNRGKTECFRLHVAGRSIGRDTATVGEELFLSTCQGLTVALLELGVRFRLRSVHGRVLSAPNFSKGKDKKKNKTVVVHQDGPKSQIDETGANEIVLEAARRFVPRNDGDEEKDHDPFYSLTDSAHGYVFSIRSQQGPAGTAGSVAVLKKVGPTGNPAGSILIAKPAENGWGCLHLGVMDTGGQETRKQPSWLMAGPRGRLETRYHRRAWESFTLEFVEQSFAAGLREMPVSDVCTRADEADRASVRAEIAAQVAAARVNSSSSSTGGARKKTSRTNSGFDHGAAIAGLSEADKSAPGVKSVSVSQSSETDAKTSGSSRSTKTSGIPSSGSSSGVAASLPRNVAAKKGNKKAKKKKKQRGQQQDLPSRNTSKRNGSSQSSTPDKAPKAKEGSGADQKKKSSSSSSVGSASTEGGAAASGPPCAACGRNLSGTYTKAMGRDFHPQCFCCRICRRPLLPGAGQFREHGGVPYCGACYASTIAPKCARCSKPIVETVTTAMDKTWHKECLTCVICRLPLTQQFWLYADKPNEPRCSRCVTGSEEALAGGRYSSRSHRPVNLPGPLFDRGNHGGGGGSMGALPGPPSGSNSSGRARLTTPIVSPSTGRR